ncbi:hypothetical protein LPJ59_002427 [Coemansia sp. RSA 2399]|nr:hypothetical protein LPJ59_002427 [Coemansia sp. RSA 2399]
MLVADAFEGNISDDAGGYPLYSDTGPAEEDIELELGREADTSIELERLAEEEEALNLRMNIPWLDPDIVYSYSARPRASISRPVSIRTESSPAIGVRHSIGSSVGISPSGPDVPSSDPLISDDELDIQQFQLEVGDLVDQGDADSRSITSDMDSFLSAGRAKYSLAHEGASLENIDPELQSFQKFMVARMRDCGKTTIAFSDVIIDPFKTRRVAARAFVDVLQMATMSVFRVSQEKQTSEIRISLI